MRGGKREGAGRPLAAPTAVIKISLPLPVHKQVKELGGSIWIRRVINEEISRIGRKANPVKQTVIFEFPPHSIL